jgi:hypothetical protein
MIKKLPVSKPGEWEHLPTHDIGLKINEIIDAVNNPLPLQADISNHEITKLAETFKPDPDKIKKRFIEALDRSISEIEKIVCEPIPLHINTSNNDKVKYVLPDYVSELLNEISVAMSRMEGIDSVHDYELFYRIQEARSHASTNIKNVGCVHCTGNPLPITQIGKLKYVFCPYCGRKL